MAEISNRPFSAAARHENVERLAQEEFDLLIIGGGRRLGICGTLGIIAPNRYRTTPEREKQRGHCVWKSPGMDKRASG